MTQRPLGIDAIAYELLDLFGLRKSLGFLSGEDQLIIESYLKNATTARHEAYPLKILFEGRE